MSSIFSDDELQDLYQQVVIDHSKKPRNFRKIENADAEAEGYNALCGDHIWIYLKLAQNAISDVSFTGAGCAICTATASLMTQILKGMPREDAEHVFEHFHQMVTGQDESAENIESLGKLAALAGVRKFPMRVKCATLPWHTLKAALDQKEEEVVSTE